MIPSDCQDYSRQADGSWRLKQEKVSSNVQKKLDGMRLPPAWRNVVVSADRNAKVQAIGMDAAGRWQYRYSAEHIAAAKKRKFDRVKLFSRDLSTIRSNVTSGVDNNNAKAMLLRIEDKTAIRMGSLADVKAKKKAYGLTTLQSRHVSIKGDKIVLDFTAKKGIPAYYEFTDKTVGSWLSKRKTGMAANDRLFPDVSPSALNKYIENVAGGKKYTIKDFRTYHGSRIAFEELQKHSGRALTAREKSRIIKDVSTTVSQFLHNTPAMAKSAYIDPMVWEIIGGL